MSKKWSEEEIELLKQIYPNGEKEEVEKIFNRKFKAISEYARRLGIFRFYAENHKIWTKEKIDYLILNFANASFEEMEQKIGTNARCIRTRAYSLGLKRDDFWWTPERIKILKEMYLNDEPIEEICKAVDNDSPFAVYAYANTHGIIRENRYWTDEQLNILRKNYYDKPWKFLTENLNRTRSAINSQANKMGLERRKKIKKEEDDYIKENFGKISVEEIAKHINRSEIAIHSRASKLKLTTPPKWENVSKEELLKLLVDLSIQLQRTPVGDELTSFGLPSPITYSRIFGTYSNAIELAGLGCTALFGKRCYSKNGDLCLSISEAIVTNFLIDNRISYQKEQFYSKYIEEDNSRRTVDWILNDGTFVEYFGLPEKEYYLAKIQEKRKICKENNINLIEIFDKDLKDLNYVFKDYLS
jgi:hypothetical protein